ncbi:MAG TPA: SGNH/GDSL hydrolase family protein, partial [Phycisphaerae bacterium]|nr:SGNH/GDSL hydrolase family protein [Phycisphaerae bacterium]
ITYELFGAVVVGILLFRHAGTAVLFCALIPLFSPGLAVILTAAAWRIDGDRIIPISYPLFFPALAVMAAVAFLRMEGETISWAAPAGALLGGAFVLLAALAFRRRKGTHYAAPVIVLALLSALLATETAARLYGQNAPMPRHGDIPLAGDWKIALHTNLLGNNDRLREIPTDVGPVPAPKPEGTIRIACLGSSTTAPGRIQAPEDLNPGKLEALLNRDLDGRFEVINAGLGGYKDFQLFIYLRDILSQASPDVVTFYYGLEETDPAGPRAAYRKIVRLLDDTKDWDFNRKMEVLAAGSRSPILRFWHRAGPDLELVRRAREAIRRARELRYHVRLEREGVSPLANEETLKPTREEVLARMVTFCREADITFVMVPSITKSFHYEDAAYATIMKRQAEKGGALLIDPLDAFRQSGDPDLFFDHVYLSRKGHALLAKVLADGLRPMFGETP